MAFCAFMANGYAGASMLEIATRAKASTQDRLRGLRGRIVAIETGEPSGGVSAWSQDLIRGLPRLPFHGLRRRRIGNA